MRVQSIGGARYFITFIDDYSRWCEVRFLKDEVINAFKAYKNLVEKQTGEKIKFIQSDNSKEYCNRELDNFLSEKGIQRLIIPHTSQQNGVAERKNRTLCETARCLMIDSNMSQGFWAKAVLTANYIRNRCFSNSIDGKIPFECWTGRVPNLKHMRTFGCRVVALNKNPARGKFDPRGRECILIGYSDVTKAYRVWYPSERKVEVTRDIVFLENSRSNMKYDDFIDDSDKQNENNDNNDIETGLMWISAITPHLAKIQTKR